MNKQNDFFDINTATEEEKDEYFQKLEKEGLNAFSRQPKLRNSPEKEITYKGLFDHLGNPIKEDSLLKGYDPLNDSIKNSQKNVTIRKKQKIENNSPIPNTQDDKGGRNLFDEAIKNLSSSKINDHKTASTESNVSSTAENITLQVHYKILHGQQLHTELTTEAPITSTIDLSSVHRLLLEELNNYFNQEKLSLELNLENWSISDNMADIPIKDITDLIKEYKGEEKDLNTFIKNIDKLWNYIDGYTQNDKNRFMLVLQLKLTEKAADATKEVDFNEWGPVKTALKENINPQKNIEKAELKLNTVKQNIKEDVEDYAKRVEELLENLNKSFSFDAGNEIVKMENDRKARKAFENGLFDASLRDRAIARGNKTFKDSVDYVTEQELRQTEFKTKNFDMYCNFCKTKTHHTKDCRRRSSENSSQERKTEKDVTCYLCNKKGHYASECRTRNDSKNPNNSNNTPKHFSNDRNSSHQSTGNNSRSPGNSQNRPENKGSNIRTYEKEIPIEEAIAYAEMAHDETKN